MDSTPQESPVETAANGNTVELLVARGARVDGEDDDEFGTGNPGPGFDWAVC
jgi:hypothetical protein